MKKKYFINLSGSEKQELRELINKGVASSRKITRARIILLANKEKSNREIAEILDIGASTVERTRKKYCEEGLQKALEERPRPGGKKKLNGHQEAHVVAFACEKSPEGRARYTLRLIADKMVEMNIVDSISYETVRRTLKKIKSSPGSQSNGV